MDRGVRENRMNATVDTVRNRLVVTVSLQVALPARVVYWLAWASAFLQCYCIRNGLAYRFWPSYPVGVGQSRWRADLDQSSEVSTNSVDIVNVD